MRTALFLACSALASCRNVPMIDDAHEAALDPSTLDLARELDSLRQDVAKVRAHAHSKAFTGVGRFQETLAAGIEEYSAERATTGDLNMNTDPAHHENLVEKYGVEWHKRQKKRAKAGLNPFKYCCLTPGSKIVRKQLTPRGKCRGLETICIGLVTVTGDEATVCAAASLRT